MNRRALSVLALALAASLSCAVRAQSTVSEDFTGATTNNPWFFYNGACLTAGSSTSTSGPGSVPACTTVLSTYYSLQPDHDASLVGGFAGYLGSASPPSTADPVGSGALRFTNGFPYGHHESGAIVSANTFSTGQGVHIQFKTVTYLGNSGGAGHDGADGMSFYLLDGCMPLAGGTPPAGCPANPLYPQGASYPGIGAWGGSLAYTCSNTNPPYDGLVGGYLGLGIDEYGNFLNGTTNTLGETGTTATGDNTASGGGYQPGRIGLRGAGNISWQALSTVFGANPNNPSSPYYPTSLASTCATGTYNSTLGTCATCSNGTYAAGTNTCDTCPANGSGLDPIALSCGVCPAGTTYDPTNGTVAAPCASCPNGSTYATGNCTNGGVVTPAVWLPQGTQAPTQAAPGNGVPYSQLAVQNTCATGLLYNYSTATAPTSAGPASLANPLNTGGILDYGAIPGAYSVLSGVQIANEAAATRAQATPILYDVKITQDGLLSFEYSLNGGALQQVIKGQSITTSNGPLPASFRFGFAGSTGGSTNVHEIMCFTAAPNNQSAGSAGVNEKQSAKVQSGAFAYFTYYNPDDYSGRLTANGLGTDASGNLVVAGTPTWDASCVLSGIANGATCSTGVAGPVAAEAPASRTILTWNGTAGSAFEFGSLTTPMQQAIDSGDASLTQHRVNYLRGVRINEVNSSGTCPDAALGLPCFRARDSVLADIIDSSPTWVGPPSSPYTAVWKDHLYAAATMQENTGTQNYLGFVSQEQTRANVVYVGANDGLLHGFRTGGFDANGNFTTATTPNDGLEVLAYMPGSTVTGVVGTSGTSVVDTIHGTDPTNNNAVTPNIDYSNTQYGHNYFVDATPGTGDLFFNNTWHTWLVGGLGGGGAAIYALDVTDAYNGAAAFSEANASNVVIGEWNPTTINCSNVTNCGANLGNTYGTPQIRRLHNGTWGIIFGNGFGSPTGDAGIYILTVDQNGNELFYYLSTGQTGKNDGIAYVTPADLDGDHITDYVYAGDLNGNVWRFDLTSNNAANWTAATNPLFTTPAGEPITTQLVVASGPSPVGSQQLIVSFGTGQKTGFTNTSATSYTSGTQAIYGVWDWNLTAWDAISAAQYAALSPANTGLGAPYTITQANLQAQTFTINANGDRDIAQNATVCWQSSTACGGNNNQFGWYVNLPGTSEQIVFNPELIGSALIVNSTIPPNNNLLTCNPAPETGFTYALSVMSGGAFTNFFPLYNDAQAAGVQTNATGTSFPVKTATGQYWLVYQTYVPGLTPPPPLPINVPSNVQGHRVTWVELR